MLYFVLKDIALKTTNYTQRSHAYVFVKNVIACSFVNNTGTSVC